MRLSSALRPNGRRGIVAPTVAILLTVIVGVGALAVDASLLMADRRKAQATADAAALAAAIDLYQNWSSNQGSDPSHTAKTSASDTAKDNGFTNGTNGVVVTVNIPPLNGTYVGQAGYAEVIITMPQQRFLSGIWGSGNLSVAARAVARGTKSPPAAGLIVLDPSGSNTLTTSNAGGITVTGGSIIVDSTDANAGHISNAGNITANNFYFSGNPGYGSSGAGQFVTTNGGAFYSNQTATPDPYLNSLVWPAQPAPTYTNININSLPKAGGSIPGFATVGTTTGWTLPPGTYSGGLTINDNTAANTYTLQTGLYYFTGGGLSLNGSAAVQSGTGGVLLDFHDGNALQSTHQDPLTLSPWTAAPGILSNFVIIQPYSNTSQDTLTGQGAGSLSLTGTVYTPAAKFTLTGGGANYAAGSQYIVYQMSVTNSGGFDINYNGPTTPPGRQLYLVE